jgi:hypothetical protein
VKALKMKIELSIYILYNIINVNSKKLLSAGALNKCEKNIPET